MRTGLLLAALLLLGCRQEQTPSTREIALGPAPAEVRRLVTLAPSLTDVVVALGAADRIVGVTKYDDAPEVKDTVRVGGYSDPSPETVVRLAPDLVLAQPSPGNRGAVYLLAEAGIPVRAFPLETLEDLTYAIDGIGRLLGEEPRANALVTQIESARRQARENAKKRGTTPRVAVLYGTEPLIAAGPGSFAHELLEDVGAVNVVARSAQPYPRISPERLVAQNPDFIVLTGGKDHGIDPEHLPAVLRSRSVRVFHPGFMRPGPNVVGALEELQRVLTP